MNICGIATPSKRGGYSMELNRELLLGASLDSVVKKASELEKVLRSCKNVAAHETTSNTRSSEGRGRHHGDCLDVNHLPSPSPGRPDADKAGVAEHWHQLSSYIVGLEKELQYYKQLVEEGQRQNATGRLVGKREQEAYLSSGLRNHLQPSAESCGSGKSSSDASGSATHQLLPGMVDSHEVRTVFSADEQFWKKLLAGDGECRILLSVFSYLTTAELCRVARVSRKWYTISKHPDLWSRVAISETVITSQTLATLSQWCSKTEHLSLHGLMPEMASCDEDLQTYITRIKGSLEPGLVAILMASSQTLVSVAITECNLMITERLFWLLGVHCPSLEALSYCSDEFPPSSEALWSLAQGSRHIKHLKLPPVLGSPNATIFNDTCLFQLAQCWPRLLSLTVGGNELTAVGLAKVAQCCVSLSHLELIYGPDIDKATVEQLCSNGGLPSLRVLILNFTAASRAALELLIENCPTLECLHLHITLQLYFPESTDAQPDTFSTYVQIVANLQKLENHSKGKGIFQLFEHYSGIKTKTKN